MAEEDQDVKPLEILQSMIDIFAERLVGLRTQCSTSNELTQSEIRTLEVNTFEFFIRISLQIGSNFVNSPANILSVLHPTLIWCAFIWMPWNSCQDIPNRSYRFTFKVIERNWVWISEDGSGIHIQCVVRVHCCWHTFSEKLILLSPDC